MLKKVKWICGRLSHRPDSEHVQNLIRLVIVSLFIVYLSACWYAGTDLNKWRIIWLVLLSDLGVSLALMVAIIMRPQISHVRRCIGIMTDYTSMTVVMLLMGEAGSPVYAVCLWVTIGNGLRYGSAYLLAATTIGALSFLTVILISAYWKSNPFLAWGLLIGLVAIPLYFQSLLKALIHALKDARQANEAKSRFLANMSHEFRTPLNGLSGMTEVLATTRLDAEQRECLNTIQASVHSLLSLIEEVLDISRIEAGKIRILHDTFSLQEVIGSVGLILRPQIRNKGLEYRVDVGLDVPEWLLGDAGYVRQVLLNIAGNAVKFTERGWITLCVSVLNRRSGHHSVVLRFEVADTGIGVPLGMRSRLFDVFEQADVGLDRRYQGSGLGTTIAKGLIELMGGRIGFEENVPCGSLFWFELPFELGQAPVVAQEVTEESQLLEASNVIAFSNPFLRHRARVKSMRVLVADDHETNRMVLSRILDKAGHKVLCVDGAEAVLDSLIGMEFDVVIVDLHMPGMSGLDMLKQLRVMQSSGMPYTPVLVLSADVTSDSIRCCEEAGARAFLPKPVLATKLLDVLAEIAEDEGSVLLCDALPPYPVQKRQVFDPAGLDELAELNMGDGFEEQFIVQSLRDAEHCQQAMLSASEANQWQEVREQAHALHGVLGHLGFMRASSLVAELMRIPDWQLKSEWCDRVRVLHEALMCGRDALDARRQERRRGETLP
ncbi:response regulator [Xylella taiwanensis]|uniref:Sensory/regulatory protein RpfC n=1 Tax=Xylella taiwanensis TaxID=1444770 RepID=Z9JKM1_9GAMM|nr:histidine kinase dimerization/phospho-acceptor domain-containing protein [Xylella taiwanensis]AXI82922.1 ATPase [Xylella taiwanensis]EWS78381.1 ATPase [Xylella taiwanensis]MCD8455941.1 response regulator [Xylella taiwanensis]MCD8458344.1 response regulator [Xylella taiwanensis]MCD8460483.1 response regulator [Xylella taiwanensis]